MDDYHTKMIHTMRERVDAAKSRVGNISESTLFCHDGFERLDPKLHNSSHLVQLTVSSSFDHSKKQASALKFKRITPFFNASTLPIMTVPCTPAYGQI